MAKIETKALFIKQMHPLVSLITLSHILASPRKEDSVIDIVGYLSHAAQLYHLLNTTDTHEGAAFRRDAT